MAETSKIDWTDATWNPVTGCTPISEGCKNCYAAVMARRLQAMGQAKYRNGFAVTLHQEELDLPRRWKKPRKVFVCSMGDLFHDDVPFDFIDRVMQTIVGSPHHTFQILTKRPQRMKKYFKFAFYPDNIYDYPGAPDNVWLGVTICNQDEADAKIPVLLDIPAKVRFVSVEPMLGKMDLSKWLVQDPYYLARCLKCGWKGSTEFCTGGDYFVSDGCACPKCYSECNDLSDFGINWVICGGETGPNARPINPDGVRSLQKQCQEAGVPFFFKQWNKKGDCLLDGKEYKELPKPAGVPAQ